MDGSWLQCDGTSKFVINSRSSVSHPGRDYQIVAHSSNSPFTGDVMSTHDDENLLHSKLYKMTLDEWLVENNVIKGQLCHLDNDILGTKEQIACPTSEGLTLIRALLKAVGNLHFKNSSLSLNADFGICPLLGRDGIVSDFDIIILQNQSSQNKTIQERLQDDILFLIKLIFNKILAFPSSFSNAESTSNPPRLPKGLAKIRMQMQQLAVTPQINSLTGIANNYAIMDWQSRMRELKRKNDQRDLWSPNEIINWSNKLIPGGALHQFYNDTGGRTGVSTFSAHHGKKI